MNLRLTISTAFILVCGPALLRTQINSGGTYSTCPDPEHAVMRSVAYLPVSESDLRKWAIVKPGPTASAAPELIRVTVQVEGERVFCASALSGPAEKQRAAVDAAMRWRFKKHRGDFKDYVMGTVSFRF